MCERLKAIISNVAKFVERPKPLVSHTNRLVKSCIYGIDDRPSMSDQLVSPTNKVVHSYIYEFPWSKRNVDTGNSPP